MSENKNVMEFKSFAIGLAIIILFSLTVHYAGAAYVGHWGKNALFIFKLVAGMSAILGGIFFRMSTLSVAFIISGLIVFLSAVMLYWPHMNPTLKFWFYLMSLALIVVLGYFYEKKR